LLLGKIDAASNAKLWTYRTIKVLAFYRPNTGRDHVFDDQINMQSGKEYRT